MSSVPSPAGTRIDAGRLPLLEVLSAEALAAITPLLSERRVAAGTTVFEQDAPAIAMYILREGEAEVVKRAHGHEMVVNRLEPVTAIGGMGLLADRTHSASVRATTACELVVVPAAFVEVARSLDPRGLGEVFRLALAMASDLLRRADEVTVRYFSDLLAKREEEQLERELSQLLVHDLRSPLAICEAGISHLLEQRDKNGPLTPRQERALKRSRRSAVFMRALIDEILEVARTDGGAARNETTTLREVLFEALTQVMGAVQGPELDDAIDYDSLARALSTQQVELDIAPALLSRPLLVDRFRLVQVVMNLVGNAAKHAPGWLAVRVRDDGSHFLLSVVDRGSGIPVHLREAIFERYRQVDLKNQGVRRGFGLGLAGAAQLAVALGGTITVADGDGGVGTAMSLRVPWEA